MKEYRGTNHRRVSRDNIELPKLLPNAMISRDYQGVVDVDILLYLVLREIKKGATVALSGECANEIDIIRLNQKP